jgi:lactoylglutathione lyase
MTFDPWRVIRGPKDGRPRILHTMLRVRDLDASLRFYVEGLGMQVLERVEIEARRATGVFVGFNAEDVGRLLELTWYWDADQPYSHGTGYGHVGIATPDIAGTYARLEAMGASCVEPPSVVFPGAPARAFAKDPDGYDVELIEVRAAGLSSESRQGAA